MKRHVSILLEVAECIYQDATAKCSAQVFQKRDLETLRSRVKHEGLSFLTITLPDFARDFERCLELGQIDSTLFRSFKKRKAIPAFLQGMLSHVFDVETGRMYDNVETENAFQGTEDSTRSCCCPGGWGCRCGKTASHLQRPGTLGEANPQCDYDGSIIESVRSFCRAFAKLELDCTPQRVAAEIEAFKETEQELLEATKGGRISCFTRNCEHKLLSVGSCPF